MRGILLSLILIVISLIIPKGVIAANEFSASYDISYSVAQDGTPLVTENIKLKNLTDKFFPSSFSIIVPGKEISAIEASDTSGKLEVESSIENGGTKILVKFTNQQIIGIGKEYGFTLKFLDKSIISKLGNVWSIRIPKITQQAEVENLSLNLSVPTSFGDPDYILPAPEKVSESGGRINFLFSKDTALQSGISAIFGRSINYSFESTYNLKNSSIFPKFLSVPISLNSAHQKTFIEIINPRPENTETNSEGVDFAIFKLNPGEQKQVKTTGFIQTSLNSSGKDVLNTIQTDMYLREDKYWAKNNPVIKAKAAEILEGKESFSTVQKAKEIDKYVSNFLRFDYSRLEKGDFQRLGSLTSLNNPEKVLSAEFTDLEIALLRSAGIPARQIVGFSLPQDAKPFSYKNKFLHTWVEFYDSQSGWISADPAWENTSGGSVLFNFNDLNHLGLAATKSETNLILPDSVNVKVYEGEIEEKKGAELDVKVNTELLSGFPSKATIKINNLGNSLFPASTLKIDSSKIHIQKNGEEPSVIMLINTPEIPPFGSIEYDFILKTGAIWHSYQDAFQVDFAGVTDTRIITVKPILSYKIFAVEITGAFIIIVLFYVLTLLMHIRLSKKS